MKLPLVLIAILLVPLFAWLNHRHYERDLKPKLLEQVRTALRAPDLSGLSPEVSANVELDELDVVLTGEARTVELRDKAQEAADAVLGARATDSRNHITVPGSLTVERSAAGSFAKGVVPADVSDRVSQNLEAKGFKISADDWTSEEFIKGPEWLWKPGFENWLNTFLASSGARSVSVEGNKITLTGDATTDMSDQWTKSLEALLPRGVDVKEDFKFYPSVYHLPGYKRASVLTPENYNRIAGVLAASDIHFDVGSSTLNDAELPKVQAIAEAIRSAGSGVNYALGGHTDTTGDRETNVRLSRERALAVSAKLVELGVPANILELVAFGEDQAVGSNVTEASRQASRRVEVLIK
jgi:outer membrane protein OmpA-like peptidoglycan-associated protein